MKASARSNRGLLVIYCVCVEWHSGQSSRGYRLLCRVGRELRKRGMERPLDVHLNAGVERQIKALGERYQHKL